MSSTEVIPLALRSSAQARRICWLREPQVQKFKEARLTLSKHIQHCSVAAELQAHQRDRRARQCQHQRQAFRGVTLRIAWLQPILHRMPSLLASWVVLCAKKQSISQITP